jgi:hypothetical protein
VKRLPVLWSKIGERLHLNEDHARVGPLCFDARDGLLEIRSQRSGGIPRSPSFAPVSSTMTSNWPRKPVEAVEQATTFPTDTRIHDVKRIRRVSLRWMSMGNALSGSSPNPAVRLVPTNRHGPSHRRAAAGADSVARPDSEWLATTADESRDLSEP